MRDQFRRNGFAARNTMAVTYLVTIFALIGLLLTGCSGGAGEDVKYQGTYRSAYSIPGLNQSGIFSYTVGQRGEMTGSFTDAVTNRATAFAGDLNNSGSFSGNMTDGSASYPISGTIATSNGVGGGGDFRVTVNNQQYTGAFTVGETPVINTSDYQGSYTGVYNISGLNLGGSSTFSVDRNGSITGLLTNGGETALFSGTVQNTGQFTGTVGFASGALLLTGTLTKTANGSSLGNFTTTKAGQTYAATFGPTPPSTTSDYRGYYNGVYTIPGLNLGGNNTFAVDGNGNITGLLTRNNTNGTTESAVFSGVVSNAGAFTGTVAYTDGALPVAGTLVKTADSTSVGNFTATKNGQSYAATFGQTTVRQGDSPYRGAYRGTYGMPELGENGNVSFTISPDGSLTGFFAQTQNKPTGTFVGTFNNDGTFNGALTYPTGSPAPYDKTRSISGKVAESTVANAAGFAGDFTVSVNGQPIAGNMQMSNGSSEPDSVYRASYTDGGHFPDGFRVNGVPGGVLTASSSIEFSVDKEGSFFGKFGTHRVEGRITNDSRFVCSIRGNDNREYPVRGILNKLTWTLQIGTNADGSPIFKDFPGAKGDLLVTVNGEEYPMSLKIIGGDGITRKR